MSKPAGVRLNLDGAGFLTALKQLEREAGDLARGMEGIGTKAESAGHKTSTMGKVMRAGIDGAKRSASELGGQLKSLALGAVTLGGALSFGAAAKGAVEMTDRYDDMAFNVNKVKGNLESAAAIQKDVETAASNSGRKVHEMADAYDAVFHATGDLAYTKAAIEVIGTTATATGKNVNTLSEVAQMLGRKFKVSAAELPEAMAKFIEKTDVGGKSLDEMGARFGMMAGEASDAGMVGSKGISELLGMMNMLDSKLGENLEPAMKMFFQVLKTGGAQAKNLQLKAGVKFAVDDTLTDKLQKLMSTPRARSAAKLILTADARSVFDELEKPVSAALDKAKAEGKKGKELNEIGVKAFNQAMSAASESAMGFAELQKQFDKVKGGPEENLNEAMNKMEAAFSRPQMIAAIEKLAEVAPKLADAMVKALELAMKHPWMAGAAVVGGKPAVSGITSAIGAGLGVAGAAVGKQMLVKLGLSGAATAAAEGAAGAGAAAGAGGAAAGVGAAALAASAALVIAAAGTGAATGYGIGKLTVDPRLQSKNDDLLRLSMAERGAGHALESGDKSQMAAAVKELRDQITLTKQNGGGFLDTVFGGMAHMVDKGYQDPNKKSLKGAEEQLAKLEKALGGNVRHTDRAGNAMNRAGEAVDRFANKLDNVSARITTAPGSHGLPPAPGNAPGSAPPR